jgi:uncharacterized protein YfaS (alpha-2-macroglobulin family)
MSIDNFNTGQNCYTWINNLVDGKPIKGAKLSYICQPYYHYEKQKKSDEKFTIEEVKELTNDDGFLKFLLNNSTYYLIAEKENDCSFINGIYQSLPFDTYRIFVFDDRKMYKPKEIVTIKGFARLFKRNGNNNCFEKIEFQKDMNVSYTVQDGVGSEIIKNTTTKLNENGSFKFEFTIPDNANLGDGKIRFNSPIYFDHIFKIQGINLIFKFTF